MLNSQKAQELFTGLLGEVLKVHNPKLSEKFDLEGVRHVARTSEKFNKQYHEVLTKVVDLEEKSINTETPEGVERLLNLMTDLNNLVNFVGFTDTKAMVFYDPDIADSSYDCHFYVVLKDDLLIINEIVVNIREVVVNVYNASLEVEVEDVPHLIMTVLRGYDYPVRGKIKIKDPGDTAQTLRNIAQGEVGYYEEQDGNVGMMFASEMSYLANGSVDLSYSINTGDLQALTDSLQVMVGVRNNVSEKTDETSSKEEQLNNLTTYVDTADGSYKETVNALLEVFKEVATTLDEQAQKVHDSDNEEEEHFEEIECGVSCDCLDGCEEEEDLEESECEVGCDCINCIYD
jgi:hypothetical protein